MSSDANAAAPAAQTARHLLRSAWKATLATRDVATGVPYGSLVAVATGPDGTPLLLLSGLALHTKNLKADPGASLLFDGTSNSPRALTGPRVTVVGRLQPLAADAATMPMPIPMPIARRRYLARHPAAAQFVDFADFESSGLFDGWGTQSESNTHF